LRLLVYEYASGGGFTGKPMPVSILSEGFSMLRAVVADFKAAGHSVTTVLDSRLATLNPPVKADCIVPVASFCDAEQAIQRLTKTVDAVYIVAPESNQVLQSLVASIEREDVASLNCRASAISNVSDKAAMLKRVKEIGLAVPKTVILNASKDITEITQIIHGSLGFPVIIKPVDGVSCTGLSVVSNEQQVAGAVSKAKSESTSKHFVAQELIRGTAASVSLIATDIEALSVSLNRQDVSLMAPEAASTYNGGQVPFDNPLKREAFDAAEAAVKAFQGLRGYVGVDLMLTEKEVVVMEVNPRLTVSYVGLRKVAGFNLAQAIVNAALDNELPESSQSRGYAVFSKVNTAKPTIETLQKTYSMNSVVSPPFPVSDNDTAYTLILSSGTTLKEAKAESHEAKKRLRSIIRIGG
jgi:predicted ATP-grasp superfamily ATP-dependent carboligase